MRIKQLILLLLPAVFATTLPAQTIIDLNSGSVRAKDIDDYRYEKGLNERQKKDSLAYIDHLTRAFNALHADSLDEAERRFFQALKTRPDAPGNYIIRYHLGQIEMARGKFPAAIEHFTNILKAHPATHSARYNRAVCYYEMNSLNAGPYDGEAFLRKKYERNDDRIRLLVLQAAVYTKNKRHDMALRSLEEILRLEPGNAAATLLMAGTLESLGQPQASLEHLNAFIAAHPDNPDGYIARAQLEVRLNMKEAARIDYDYAIRLRPAEAALYAERAKLLIELEAGGSARKDIERALDLGYPRMQLTELMKKIKK